MDLSQRGTNLFPSGGMRSTKRAAINRSIKPLSLSLGTNNYLHLCHTLCDTYPIIWYPCLSVVVYFPTHLFTISLCITWEGGAIEKNQQAVTDLMGP